MELIPPSTSHPMSGPLQAPAAASPPEAAQQPVSPFSAVSSRDDAGNGHASVLSAPLLPPTFAGHPHSNAAEQHAKEADHKPGIADGILQLTSDTVSPRNFRTLDAVHKLDLMDCAHAGVSGRESPSSAAVRGSNDDYQASNDLPSCGVHGNSKGTPLCCDDVLAACSDPGEAGARGCGCARHPGRWVGDAAAGRGAGAACAAAAARLLQAVRRVRQLLLRGVRRDQSLCCAASHRSSNNLPTLAAR